MIGDQMYFRLMSTCSLSSAKLVVSTACLAVYLSGCKSIVEIPYTVVKGAVVGGKKLVEVVIPDGPKESTFGDDPPPWGDPKKVEPSKPISEKPRRSLLDNTNTRKIKSAFSKQASERKVMEYKLITLDLSGLKLTGINHLGSGNFSNLRSLDLSDNSITDLSPLYNLHELRVLILNGNKGLSDREISFVIGGLRSCTVVYSTDFGSPLPPSTTRKDRYFGWRLENSQREILQLISKKVGKKTKEIVDSDLGKISSLDLSETKVSDLKSIRALGNLKVLDISGTPVKSVESLDGMGLKMLIAQDCLLQPWQLRNFASGNPKCFIVHPEMANPARSGIVLSEIDLTAPDNRTIMEGVGVRLGVGLLKNIELPELKKIKRLYLADKDLRDISLLASMSDLEYLDLDDNVITDISWLRSLANLKTLYLQNNMIRDITPLEGLVSLKYLFLEGNPIDRRSIRILKMSLPNAIIVAGSAGTPKSPAPLAVRQAKESVWHMSREVRTLTGTDEFGRSTSNLTPENLWLRVGEAKLRKLNWEKYWDADWKLKRGSLQEIRLKKQWQEMGQQKRQAFLKRQGLSH